MSSPPSDKHITTGIDSAFNALLAEAFLCGLYTLLFAYSLQTLLRKEDKKVYASVLTLLWIFVMLVFALDWQYSRMAFVIDNDTPLDIFVGVINGPSVPALRLLDNMLSNSCIWLADALLIWRCYILWEDKKWVLLPLPILLIADVVLGSLWAAFLSPVPQISIIFLLSFFTVSIAITFIGTSLIILRILLVTRSSLPTSHISAYRKIQRILVESGIIYTVTMFIAGVMFGILVTLHVQESGPLNVVSTYTEALLIPLSGIGPTLIAVRVGHEGPLQTDAGPSRTRTRSHALSHLTFRRTTRQNATLGIEDGIGVSPSGDSPTNFSGQDGCKGDIENVAVRSSDTALLSTEGIGQTGRV